MTSRVQYAEATRQACTAASLCVCKGEQGTLFKITVNEDTDMTENLQNAFKEALPSDAHGHP
jgi:hypothetical protein